MNRLLLILLLATLTFAACKRQGQQSVASNVDRMSDSSLASLYDRGLISRDSLLAVLSYQGRIGDLGPERLAPNQPWSINPGPLQIARGKRIASELRAKLKYKFALDYAMSKLDSTEVGNLNPDDAVVVQSSDSLALEQFDLLYRCTVYRVHDFAGSSEFYLFSRYVVGGYNELVLFSQDSLHALLDEKLYAREASCRFAQLNGGFVISSDYRTWGTGYNAMHTELATIEQRRFKVLYSTYTSIEAGPPWSEPSSKTIGDVRFLDINGDGFLDIQEHVTVFSSTDSTLQYWDDSTASTLFRDETRRFLWSPSKVEFVQEFTSQL